MQELAHQHQVKIGLQGSLFVLSYEQTPTLETAGAIAQTVVPRFEADPGLHAGVLTIIDATLKPPDGPTRAAISQMMKSHERQVDALAHVIVGSGFQASTVRAVLVGINLLSRAEYPVKVFSRLPEAISWLSAKAPKAVAPAEIAPITSAVQGFHSPSPRQ